MSRVDFYVLESSDDDSRRLFTCKLAEKAYRNGLKSFIRVADAQEAARLNDSLWTFRQGSFVPHALAEDQAAVECAVLIGIEDRPLPAGSALVINLCDSMPGNAGQIERIIEIVDAEPRRRRSARERYRYYKEIVSTLNTHNIGTEVEV
jgi:DNA polymerase-3 subunit chi